jgi:hypothetical protein
MAFGHEDYCALVAAIQRDPYDEVAEAKLRKLQERWTGDPAGLGLVIQEIVLCLRVGLVYVPRRQAWITPDQARRGGRPRNPHLETVWQLARVELLLKLGRKPSEKEIAEHILGPGDLRLIGDIKAIISVDSLLRERRRGRKNPPSRFCAGTTGQNPK